VQIVERLDEVLGATAASAELGDQDGLDFVGGGQRHDFGALRAGHLLEHRHDLVASALGERPQVPFLALARLFVGRDAAVDRRLLSQLNPLISLAKMPAFVRQNSLQPAGLGPTT